MEIVVNEWLLDYLRPNSEKFKRDLALKFVNTWVKNCDKVLIRRPSPFIKKFYTYMKQFESDLDFKKRFKKVNELLFYNLDKTIIIDDNEVKSLPEGIGQKDLGDDKYLIELAYSSTDPIIVTTDERLKEKLKDESDLKVYLLEEFMKNYSS
jgi:predicted nucleic acid-binding protein